MVPKIGIYIHLVAPSFEIPKNSTAMSNIIPIQYKTGIILSFFLIGNINTKKKAKKEIVKYTICLLANCSFVSLIKWYDKNINGKTNIINK